ncbi:MAG: META domain-containing protein [Anaerolineales bacterium]
MFKYLIFVAPILSLTMVACVGGSEVGLTDVNWSLTSLNGQPLVPGTYINADFDDGGNVGGTNGCNRYNGPYQAGGNSISIGPLMSTMMACPDIVMQQEQAYMAALQSASNYEISGDKLELSGEGFTLEFEGEEATLAGTSWEVISYNNGRGGVVSVIIGTELTAKFDDDGTLSGSAGCNNYNTTYEVDGENISIGQTAVTQMYCQDPEGIMEQEAEYLAALQSAATYKIEGDRMTMRTDSDSTVATFQRAP